MDFPYSCGGLFYCSYKILYKVSQVTDFYSIRQKLIFDCLDRFPGHGNMTIAKKLFNEYPDFFTSLNSTRGIVRYYRGVNGKDNFKDLKDKKYVRKPVSTT